MKCKYLPVQVGEAEQEPVLDCVEDASLVAYVAEGELLPGVLEHRDQLGRGTRQPPDLLQAFLTLELVNNARKI